MSFSMLPMEDELRKVASTLAQPGKGILAADEPLDYMDKCLGEAGVENSSENRRRYRQVLFTTGRALGEHLSGVILHPETVYQKSDKGVPFIEVLKRKGIIAGVNVDRGLVPLFASSQGGETTTQGLDDLHQRCQEFRKAGCYFAKWRCALTIGPHSPSTLAIQENAHILARYASICQANGLVPIVEPEVQLEGPHDLNRAQQVTESVLIAVYKALHDYNVLLEGTLLKPSMVTPGRLCPTKAKPEAIAAATVTALRRTVPPAVPGIGFLSGGQSQAEATENLQAINNWSGEKPWTLSFIFGRALQASVPRIWAGKDENVVAAQLELLTRAKINGEASLRKNRF